MATTTFPFEEHCDDLGPEKILHLSDAETGLRAIVVVDNVACGPAIGGVRMAPDVTTEEVLRLARAMTLKNAAAGLAHGGGKSGILADPKTADKRTLIRAFGRAIAELTDYIPGPDMGTDEACMAYLHDEIGRAVGLPRELGGIPLDDLGATGFGLVCCAEVAAPAIDLDLNGARVAVEGFGNVGRPAARLLVERGARLVAASDSRGAIHDPNGLPVEELIAIKATGKSVTGLAGAHSIECEDLIGLPCDILIPAARPDSIHARNVDTVQARLILSGANIAITTAAETVLHDRGVLSIPDFITNAGGVICAATEFHGGSETAAFERISGKIRHNAEQVIERSRAEAIQPREAAVRLARERVHRAMRYRIR